MENDAVIVSAVRTPIGKYAGSLATVKDYELGSIVMREAIQRAGIDAGIIDDVYFGNLLGLPGNVAKVAAMGAGVPDHVPAVTIDRQCASSLESIVIAAAMIQGNLGEVYMTGGCESMTNKPHYLLRSSVPYEFSPPDFLNSMFVPPEGFEQLSMGNTAENILKLYPYAREELDAFALRSHTLALKAWEQNRFKNEIVPVPVKTKKGSFLFEQDEAPRASTTMEVLGKLRPCFQKDGTVTAGNSCPMNDGATALIVMSRKKAQECGCKPLVRIKAFATAGVDYKIMGLGPIAAVKKLFAKTDIKVEDVGLIELNEAFANQALACISELGFNMDIVNVNGGAIALGHPLAATGGILTTKLIYEMQRRDVLYGLVTMCIGGGQGMAVLYEKE
ncbi:MAG: acetyl-CoA C-acyltransferase [Lachnotalea sp.]